jgi:hypothetical protein
MLQQASGLNLIVGKVTSPPSWRKRATTKGGTQSFEPVIVAVVTLTGGSGWLGPMVVRLDVTRLDAGVCTSSPGLQEPARETMRRFLYRNNGSELLKLNAMRMSPPKASELMNLEPFIH